MHDLWRLGVLVGWLVVACIATVLFFRWEQLIDRVFNRILWISAKSRF